MAASKIICMDISANRCPCFPDVTVSCQVCLLIFEASKPAFDHNVISPAAFSIHALLDPIFIKEVNICLAGELTP